MGTARASVSARESETALALETAWASVMGSVSAPASGSPSVSPRG
jgi:hypothetical protein